MPIPPAQPPTNLAQQIGHTAAEGAVMMPEPTQIHTLPSVLPPLGSTAQSAPSLVGSDAVMFSFVLGMGGSGSQIVVFPALPYRNNTKNPLSPPTGGAQQPFAVTPISILVFMVSLQNISAPAGVQVSVAAQAIDANNAMQPGPFLGHNSYKTFQATVTALGPATAGGATISGFVTGVLHLSNG